MKQRLLSIIGIVALLMAMLPTSVFAAPKPPDYSPMDIGPALRAQDPSQEMVVPPDSEQLAGEVAAAEAVVNASATDCITGTKTWMILTPGGYGFATFLLMGDSEGSQVYVQKNLGWPAGDPRPTPVVTCEQVAYLMGEFNNNIYPKETSFFGAPDFHDGSNSLLEAWGYVPEGYYDDANGRQIVLVSNIRDENYSDPTYPNYIAGFYSPSFEVYFDRNIMSIDAYDWANRVGPSGTRPYLYEGIFAHEYQHLLHDDYDSDEENWINEGMADLAMVLTGYGAATIGHLGDTAEYPENSLTVWSDQGGLEILADYGQAFLFQYYLMEKFGPTFIQALFHNPLNSISSVEDTLAQFGIDMSFSELFNRWTVAMVIDSATPGGGRYQFKGLDFKFDLGTPADPNPEAYSTPGVGPWGSDFIWISGDPKQLAKLTFNGVDYATFPTNWTSDGSMLWSGTGDLLDNWAIFETVGGGTLTFDTIWDLEDYWDFGFVQVSTDGGHTWKSLEDQQGYSTYDYDSSAHPKVIENLPGLTSFVTDPVALSYDLSAYAGQNILVGFRMVTDWATHYGGWWIDNVMVDGTLISDGTDASVFKSLTEIIPIENDFRVTFVGINTNKDLKAKGNPYKVLSMHLSDMAETGLFELNSVLKDATNVVMIVTFEAPEDANYYVDYTYDFVKFGSGPKK